MSDNVVTGPTEGFPAVAGPGARVLRLGTLPGQKSLQKHQYYGHPQNVFWRIMGELFGAGPGIPYSDRVRIIVENGVAIWDVLASSVRPGSMDSAIDHRTAIANDFESLYREQSDVGLVCFNGQASAKLYQRFVASEPEKRSNERQYLTLPSTSPAYASMSFDEKLERWRVVEKAITNKRGK